jgi:hypothetical protein
MEQGVTKRYSITSHFHVNGYKNNIRRFSHKKTGHWSK